MATKKIPVSMLQPGVQNGTFDVTFPNTDVTEADVEKLAKLMQHELLELLKKDNHAVPCTPEGTKLVQRVFEEAYERVMAGKHTTVTVTVVKK